MEKITITNKQALQFNRMLKALKKIRAYQTPNMLQKSAGKQFGLEYVECLEMAYENMQEDAKFYSKGIKEIAISPQEIN